MLSGWRWVPRNLGEGASSTFWGWTQHTIFTNILWHALSWSLVVVKAGKALLVQTLWPRLWLFRNPVYQRTGSGLQLHILWVESVCLKHICFAFKDFASCAVICQGCNATGFDSRWITVCTFLTEQLQHAQMCLFFQTGSEKAPSGNHICSSVSQSAAFPRVKPQKCWTLWTLLTAIILCAAQQGAI